MDFKSTKVCLQSVFLYTPICMLFKSPEIEVQMVHSNKKKIFQKVMHYDLNSTNF